MRWVCACVHLNFNKALLTISHSILEKLPAHVLDENTLLGRKLIGWLVPESGGGWSHIQMAADLWRCSPGPVLGPALFNIIVNDLDEAIECLLSWSEDNTQWVGILRVGRFCREIWTCVINGLRSIVWGSSKPGSLHLGHLNPRQCYRPGAEGLESCPVKRTWGAAQYALIESHWD